jgi:hypothetical protein
MSTTCLPNKTPKTNTNTNTTISHVRYIFMGTPRQDDAERAECQRPASHPQTRRRGKSRMSTTCHASPDKTMWKEQNVNDLPARQYNHQHQQRGRRCRECSLPASTMPYLCASKQLLPELSSMEPGQDPTMLRWFGQDPTILLA